MRICLGCECNINSSKKITARFCRTDCKNNYYDRLRKSYRQKQTSLSGVKVNVLNDIKYSKK